MVQAMVLLIYIDTRSGCGYHRLNRWWYMNAYFISYFLSAWDGYPIS